MNIKKYIFLSLLLFSSCIYAMDSLDDLKKKHPELSVSPKKSSLSPKNKRNVENLSGSKSPKSKLEYGGIGIRPKKVEISIPMPTTRADVAKENGELESAKNSLGQDKASPKDVKELHDLIKARSIKQVPKRRKSAGSATVPPFDEQGFQKAKDRDFSDEQKKTYTREEVLELINNLQSPETHRLYDICKKNNVPMEKIPQYIALFDEINLSPRLVAECLYELGGEYKEKPTDYEVKGYEKMQEQQPEKYEELKFRLFQQLLDGMNSVEKMSSSSNNTIQTYFADGHVVVLKGHISEQDQHIKNLAWEKKKYFIGGLFSTLAVIVGWIVQWQTSSCGDPVVNGTQTG